MSVGTDVSRPFGMSIAHKDVIHRSLQTFLLIHLALLKNPTGERYPDLGGFPRRSVGLAESRPYVATTDPGKISRNDDLPDLREWSGSGGKFYLLKLVLP